MIVKVQRALTGDSVLIYNKGASVLVELYDDEAAPIIDFMGDSFKVFCHAEVNKAGEVVLLRLAPGQDW